MKIKNIALIIMLIIYLLNINNIYAMKKSLNTNNKSGISFFKLSTLHTLRSNKNKNNIIETSKSNDRFNNLENPENYDAFNNHKDPLINFLDILSHCLSNEEKFDPIHNFIYEPRPVKSLISMETINQFETLCRNISLNLLFEELRKNNLPEEKLKFLRIGINNVKDRIDYSKIMHEKNKNLKIYSNSINEIKKDLEGKSNRCGPELILFWTNLLHPNFSYIELKKNFLLLKSSIDFIKKEDSQMMLKNFFSSFEDAKILKDGENYIEIGFLEEEIKEQYEGNGNIKAYEKNYEGEKTNYTLNEIFEKFPYGYILTSSVKKSTNGKTIESYGAGHFSSVFNELIFCRNKKENTMINEQLTFNKYIELKFFNSRNEIATKNQYLNLILFTHEGLKKILNEKYEHLEY